MYLKRKFKIEHAPLVSDEKVKTFKEWFGHGVKRPETSCQIIDSSFVSSFSDIVFLRQAEFVMKRRDHEWYDDYTG